jgi:hypothetical protein
MRQNQLSTMRPKKIVPFLLGSPVQKNSLQEFKKVVCLICFVKNNLKKLDSLLEQCNFSELINHI